MNKRVVFIGGGHSHAITLEYWKKNPLPNVDLILISNVEYTPYSGMLPGHLAGFYSYEDIHINLPRLAHLTGCQFCLDEAVGLDLVNNQVICQKNGSIPFNYLSIDIGSTPDKVALEVNLFSRSSQLLRSHNKFVVHYARKKLLSNNIKIYLNQTVNKVIKTEEDSYQIECQSGLTTQTNYIIWVTQASSPDWIKNSDLSTNEKGFILVSNTLQSLSHPNVFAVGDIASIQDYPRPKAGVFAVRQGKPLLDNIKRTIQRKPLSKYYPQKAYLFLLSTGDKSAIASWSFLGFESPFLWTWKDSIDRSFMNRFKLMR